MEGQRLLGSGVMQPTLFKPVGCCTSCWKLENSDEKEFFSLDVCYEPSKIFLACLSVYFPSVSSLHQRLRMLEMERRSRFGSWFITSL